MVPRSVAATAEAALSEAVKAAVRVHPSPVDARVKAEAEATALEATALVTLGSETSEVAVEPATGMGKRKMICRCLMHTHG